MLSIYGGVHFNPGDAPMTPDRERIEREARECVIAPYSALTASEKANIESRIVSLVLRERAAVWEQAAMECAYEAKAAAFNGGDECSCQSAIRALAAQERDQ